jgi:hypothetical protein
MLPGNLGSFYAAATTRLLAAVGVPTVAAAVRAIVTGLALGELSAGGAVAIGGVAVTGWVIAGVVAVVAVEGIVDTGAALWATAPLVD